MPHGKQRCYTSSLIPSFSSESGNPTARATATSCTWSPTSSGTSSPGNCCRLRIVVRRISASNCSPGSCNRSVTHRRAVGCVRSSNPSDLLQTGWGGVGSSRRRWPKRSTHTTREAHIWSADPLDRSTPPHGPTCSIWSTGAADSRAQYVRTLRRKDAGRRAELGGGRSVFRETGQAEPDHQLRLTWDLDDLPGFQLALGERVANTV